MSKSLSRFVVGDASKCTGCKACEVACFTEHNRERNQVGRTVGTVTVPVTAKLYVTRSGEICVPVQCKHCEDAPCLNACAKSAISRIDGQVIVNEEKCIGCKDCVMACPFGAITILPFSCGGHPLVQADGTMVKAASKCDLCQGIEGGPACVRVCPNKALRLVEADEERLAKSLRTAETLYATRNVY